MISEARRFGTIQNTTRIDTIPIAETPEQARP